jgi:hypothetical protein
LQENLNSFLSTPYGIPFYFVALWCFASFFLSFISGWFALSSRFTKESEPNGPTKSAGPFFYTVYMRFWGHYGSVIRMTAAGEALYLSVPFLFRIGHPPLCVPWNEIQFSRTKYFFRPYVVLTIGSQERIPMRISERMARKLGILERVSGSGSVEIEPNFDTLSERFSDPSGRKRN